MSKIAIITARGGSKRIPKKNIRDFLGRPIIAYSIKAALESGIFDEIMVSTDDRQIAEIAINCGANVPFMRSELNSNDFATTSDVLLEVLDQYNNIGQTFDEACCIYPCAPFVTGDILKKANQKLASEEYTCIIPILQFSYPIWRALKIENDKSLSMFWPEYINSRSQDLPAAYHDAGQFYFFDVVHFLKTRNLLRCNVGGIIVDENNVQDIDTESDWRLAELKYKLRSS